MKKLLILLLLVIGYSAYSQTDNNQSIRFTRNIIFADSVRMDSLDGSGTVLRIDENGYLYRNTGTSVDTIVVGQVLGLQDSLAARQVNITTDSNFVLSAVGKLDLNDTVWVNVGTFYSEVKVSSTEPKLFLNETDASSNSRLFGISSNGGATNIGFYSDVYSAGTANITLNRSGRNMTSMHLNNTSGTSVVKLKNTGVGIFSDTLQAGKLKGAGILYPTSDGTSGQVLTTNGSGVATFSDIVSPLIAGTNITISNDTISSTGGSDSDWSVNGNYVYNSTDSIGIGTVTPSSVFDVKGFSQFTSSTTYTLTAQNSLTGTAGRFVASNGSGIEITSSPTLGYGIRLNSYEVDSISNDATLAGNDAEDLVTEQAVKGYVDNAILNDTRVSWAEDVDTSARVDGFVLKWNAGAGTHYYDTAGTGGGGSTYFAGDGLSLAANVFSIGTDSVKRYMIQDTAISYSKIQRVSPHSILARVSGSDGNVGEVQLPTQTLLGRRNGDIRHLRLGTGLAFQNDSTIQATNTGDITSVSAGNGLTGGGSSGGVTVTLGTPTTLSGSTTNSVTSTSHTHALDFGTFKSNSYGFFLDTTRTTSEFLSDSGIAITTEEKVILFTMSQEADSVLLGSGEFTMNARVVINAVNNDTLAGTVVLGGNLPKYTVKAYLVDEVQMLGRVVAGSKTELRTARVIDMFGQYREGESTAEGTLTMTINTNPTKFRIPNGYFVAVTISATYGGVVDYVKHRDASMVIEKANDYDGDREQPFE